ncbi:hypothetical protein [Aeromonas caviae]|uniref:hypothetical protein n=1 Tax=Aeromonas caviae TaxID=648 RepID=UPI001FFD6C4B|nr:hypothetical protein [Aeromonas caviae]
MNLRNTLNRLMRVVIEEAERNPNFEAALQDALDSTPSKRKQTRVETSGQVKDGKSKRGRNRRTPAILDPVQVVRDGELVLRSALEKLSLEQLRDIVAEYGMDPGRLVMKWNTPERVIDRVVEMSIARAHKGSAFRKPADEPVQPVTRADETPLSDTQLAGEPPTTV